MPLEPFWKVCRRVANGWAFFGCLGWRMKGKSEMMVRSIWLSRVVIWELDMREGRVSRAESQVERIWRRPPSWLDSGGWITTLTKYSVDFAMEERSASIPFGAAAAMGCWGGFGWSAGNVVDDIPFVS